MELHQQKNHVLPRSHSQNGEPLAQEEQSKARYSEGELKQLIRSMNLKVTNQRMAIIEALVRGRQHVTAQEVFERVSKDFPEIGFATVYRFLRDLVDTGLAIEVRMGGMPARYELKSQVHHDHLTCTQCGSICEFENEAIEKLQVKVAEQFGFTLTSHVLELYGICPACQQKEAEKKHSASK